MLDFWHYYLIPTSILNAQLIFLEKYHGSHFKRNNQKNSDPIFIVGHWRSGTTLLHNLLGLNKNIIHIFIKKYSNDNR